MIAGVPRFTGVLLWLVIAPAASAAAAGDDLARQCDAAAVRVTSDPGSTEAIVGELSPNPEDCLGSADRCEARRLECAGYLWLLGASAAGADSPGDELGFLARALDPLKAAYFGHGRSAAGATNLSLTYRRLAALAGDEQPTEARDLMRRSAEVLIDYAYSTSLASEYFIAAGDLYYALGWQLSQDFFQWRDAEPLFDEAWAIYREAVRYLATDEIAERRIVDSLQPRPKLLIERSERLKERGMLRPALAGFEGFLHWRSKRPDGWSFRLGAGVMSLNRAESALVHWVDTLARLGNPGVEHLDRLPSPEASGLPRGYFGKPLSELRALMENPAGAPVEAGSEFTLAPGRGDGQLKWWLRDDFRRDAVARLISALSRSLRVRERKQEAQAALERGFFRIAPDEDDLDEPGAFTVLELGAELGWLYAASAEETDPDGTRFERLIGRLEGAREGVDEDLQDLPLQEEYEALIGTLLIGRVEPRLPELPWEVEVTPGDPTDFDEGLAHLERSFEIDRALSAELPARALPQPDLEMLAARIHDLRGRPSEARRLLLAAASGYLDADATYAAEAAVARAEALQPDAAERSRIEALREIARMREQRDVALNSDGLISAFPAVPGLSQGFLDRQRFKLLADAGSRQADKGLPYAAVRLHIEAIRQLARLELLASPADLGRIERALSTILDRRPSITMGIGMVFDPADTPKEWFRKEYVLPQTAGRTARQLAIGADVFLAAELRALLEHRPVHPDLVLRLSEPESASGRTSRSKPDLAVTILARSELEDRARDLAAAIESAGLESAGARLSDVSLALGDGLRRGSRVDPHPPEDQPLLEAVMRPAAPTAPTP